MINIDPASLADGLRLSVGRLARRLRQQSLGGLTPSQRSVLATISRHGPLTMGGLAEMEAISRPAVTGITTRLADKGMVERRIHPDDRRSVVIALTERGADLLEAGRRERTAFLAARLARLSSEERQRLADAVDLLDRLAGPE